MFRWVSDLTDNSERLAILRLPPKYWCIFQRPRMRKMVERVSGEQWRTKERRIADQATSPFTPELHEYNPDTLSYLSSDVKCVWSLLKWTRGQMDISEQMETRFAVGIIKRSFQLQISYHPYCHQRLPVSSHSIRSGRLSRAHPSSQLQLYVAGA